MYNIKMNNSILKESERESAQIWETHRTHRDRREERGELNTTAV